MATEKQLRYWESTKGHPQSNTGRTHFKKGMTPWNKGVKGLQSAWNKGIACSEETKRKISEANKGNTYTKGKHWKIKDASNMNKDKIGKGNVNWKGGISKEPYGVEFNNELKEQVRRRDNHRCQECFRHQDELYSKSGRKYSLIVHHIDYDKKNNNKNNLISLCRNCHLKTHWAEKDWTLYLREKLTITSD